MDQAALILRRIVPLRLIGPIGFGGLDRAKKCRPPKRRPALSLGAHQAQKLLEVFACLSASAFIML